MADNAGPLGAIANFIPEVESTFINWATGSKQNPDVPGYGSQPKPKPQAQPQAQNQPQNNPQSVQIGGLTYTPTTAGGSATGPAVITDSNGNTLQILVSSEYQKNGTAAKIPNLGDGQNLTFQQRLGQLLGLPQVDQQGFIDLQTQLVQAGFLDPRASSFHIGEVLPGDATYRAYEQAMSEAITSNRNLNDVIQGLVADTNNKTGQAYYNTLQSMLGQKPVTLTAVHTTVPGTADLQGDFRGKLQQLVGADPTQEQYSAFVSAAQAFARANPELVTTEYTMGPGGSLRFPQAKDISTVGGLGQQGMDQFAESYIAQHMGTQEATAGVNNLVAQFQQMLGVK